jgi:hypothetical protein
MIIVSVSLKSAITGVTTELARMEICNDGVGTARRCHYDGRTLVGRCGPDLDKASLAGRVAHSARIENWPRHDWHVWNLVGAMLRRMGYVKEPRA